MHTKPPTDNPDQAFKRLFVRLAVVLVIIMAVLLWLTLQSGPRLRTATLDRSLVASQLGQRITLHANQPLAKLPPGSVRIEPAADFSVTNNGDIITVALKQRLKYNTRYTISIDGVTAKNSSRHVANFEYDFTTSDPAFYYLKRSNAFEAGARQPDKIYASTLHATQDELLYSAPRILDYVVLDKYLVVATGESQRASKLFLVDKDTRKVSPVDLPEAGLVSQLQASGDGVSYGFVFTGEDNKRADSYARTLFMHDISPGHIMVPVAGMAGKQVDVIDWQFAPDRTTIVAQLLDTSLLLIDGNFKNLPVPLGRHSSMSTFARDGIRLAIVDDKGPGILNLVKRSREPVPDNALSESPAVLLDLRLLSNQEGYLTHQQVPTGTIGYREYLESNIAGRTKILHDTRSKDFAILGFTTSLNDQVLAVETARLKDVGYDGYPVDPKPLSMHTLLIDAESGTTIRDVNGVDINWE